MRNGTRSTRNGKRGVTLPLRSTRIAEGLLDTLDLVVWRTIVISFRLTACELAIRRQSSFDHSIADLEL